MLGSTIQEDNCGGDWSNCKYRRITRMTSFIKGKLRETEEQMNINKYRVAANITEYYIILKLIYLRIIIPKFMMLRQLFQKDFLVRIIELLRFLCPN